MVGKMVKYCEINNKDFSDLSEGELKTIDERLSLNLMPDLSMEGCVNARVSFGGTAPSEVQRQINTGKRWLEEFK